MKEYDNITENENISPENTGDVTVTEAAAVTEDTEQAKAAEESSEWKGEDNLEIRKLSFRKRMEAKKLRFYKNTEGMTKKEKAKYVLYYYKWHFLVILALLALLIYLPVTIYKNHLPVAISYAVINSPNPYGVNTDVFEEYQKYYDIKKGYRVISNPTVALDLSTYEELYAVNPDSPNFTQFPLLCYSGYYDLVITNKVGMEYCSQSSLIYELENALPQETYSYFEEQHPELIEYSGNFNKEEREYGIDISNTEFAKSLNVGYDDVYLCFFGITSENKTNTTRILQYIFSFN